MSLFTTRINKLKNIQYNIEKSRHTFAEKLSEYDESLKVNEVNQNNIKSRVLQEEKMKNDVKQIIVPLHKIRNSLTERCIGNIDLKLMKKEMTDLQNNIHSLKTNVKVSLEVLEEEEERFSREVHIFEEKFREWSKPVGDLHSKKITSRISTVIPENVAQEVKDYVEFVNANGGHENGWNSEDHNVFLRHRYKFKDVDKLAATLHSILPDITEAEIVAHEKWYLKYIDLKEKQKIAIRNWRSNQTQIKRNSTLKPILPEQNLCNTVLECVKKEEVQQKIAAWKFLRFNQEKEKKQKDLQDKFEKQQLEKGQKQKRQQIREHVQQWRSTKKDAEEKEKIVKKMKALCQQKDRATKANRLIKQFQRLDETFIQNKLQFRLIQTRGAEAIKSNSQVDIKRDPERLFKPTKQWILRNYENSNAVYVHNNLQLQTIPKLGIPQWRKSID